MGEVPELEWGAGLGLGGGRAQSAVWWEQV